MGGKALKSADGKYTMRDVARLAGVSIGTVSAVVNGTAGVSDGRTATVRKAMEALGYEPDQVARSLKMGRTGVIGMIIPDITNPFFPEVVRGVEEAAGEAGYSVILCNSNEDAQRESRHLSTLGSRRVDGVLLACAAGSPPYQELEKRFPLVYVDRIPPGLSHSGVASDNVAAARQATQYLIGLKHKYIAYVGANVSLSPHADRLEGFRRAMQEAHLPVREPYLRIVSLHFESGRDAALELLRLSRPPTAILTSSSQLLLGIMRALAETGTRCPEQISVVGFDNHAWTANFTPSLTVVSQKTYEMGRLAIEMLLEKIRAGAGAAPQPPIRLLEAALEVRGSAARLSARSRSLQ